MVPAYPGAHFGTLVSLNSGGAVVIVTECSMITASISTPRGGLREGAVAKVDGPAPLGGYSTFNGSPQPRVVPYLLSKTKFKHARERILSGEAWDDVIRPRKPAIALAAINSVRRDYGDKTLTIGWRDGARKRSRTVHLGPAGKVGDAERSMQDAVLDRIGVNGPGWREEALPASRYRLALGPIAGLIGTAIVTAGLTYTANQNPNKAYRASGKGRLFEDLAHWLGVEGSLLLGAGVALVFLTWLIMRMLKPMLETVYVKSDAMHV